jgi:hypothetical protein
VKKKRKSKSESNTDRRGRQIEFLSTCLWAGSYKKTGCPTSKFARPTFFPEIKGNSPHKKITTIYFIIV